ncbi:unnamed protein product [Phaeothamnion confervicola]
MRRHLSDMLSQHIGDFPLRLRQQPVGPYQYCPLPNIKYQNLEGEIYLRGYYLRGLCDAKRFPDWPVAEPVLVLRAVVEAWRAVMARHAGDSGGGGSETLGIAAGCGGVELRRAYRSLARRYHPDRNPQGREQFVRVQEAYELLLQNEADLAAHGGHGGSGEGGSGGGGDDGVARIVVMVQVMAVQQVSLCQRYSAQLQSFKYPAYPLVMQASAI